MTPPNDTARTQGWEAAWQQGRTGWDAGASAPALAYTLDHALVGPAPAARALVPGCGAGYDVLALAERGWRATGVDLAPTAAKRFEQLREAHGLAPDTCRVITQDLMRYAPKHPFDFVWDYTFLCAIDPDMRADWADAMQRLIRPGGLLATLLFPVDIDDPSPSVEADSGPPYRLHPEWVERDLLAPRGFKQILCTEPPASHEGREGKEWLALWRRGGGEDARP